MGKYYYCYSYNQNRFLIDNGDFSGTLPDGIRLTWTQL